MDQKVAQHLSVLTNRFKGTGGIVNRHFVETLDALYGPGLVRRNFHHILDVVRLVTSVTYRSGPKSILAVSFPLLHNISPSDFRHHFSLVEYINPEHSRTMLARLYTRDFPIGVLYMANGEHAPYRSWNLPSQYILTEQDGAWAHDRVLELDEEFLYGQFPWSTTPAPSQRITLAPTA